MPFFLKECSIIHLKFRDPKIISTIEFENVFASYYSLVQQRIESYSNLLEKSKIHQRKIRKENLIKKREALASLFYTSIDKNVFIFFLPNFYFRQELI